MYQRMKMLLGGLILSTGLVVATPVSYAAETQVNGEEDIELAYENIDNYYSKGSNSVAKAFHKIAPKAKIYASNASVSFQYNWVKDKYYPRYRLKTILKNYKKYAGKNPIHRIKF